MRVARLHGVRDLRLSDEPHPEVPPGYDLVRVTAVGTRCVGGAGRCEDASARTAAAGHSTAAATTSSSSNQRPLGRCSGL